MFHESKNLSGKPETIFLDTVWFGLDYIYNEMKRLEDKEIARMGLTPEKAKLVGLTTFGDGEHDLLVCNYFLWYATQLTNLIGAVEKSLSIDGPLKSKFNNVITWRNKVAAHTAWVSPRREDSLATQNASIMLFPDFDAGYYHIGGWVFSSEDEGHSNTGWHWCLVKEHERFKAEIQALIN